jgi:hypothetical protein
VRAGINQAPLGVSAACPVQVVHLLCVACGCHARFVEAVKESVKEALKEAGKDLLVDKPAEQVGAPTPLLCPSPVAQQRACAVCAYGIRWVGATVFCNLS